MWNNFWQRGSVHSFVPAVLGTQLCGSRPSYWEQTSPAGLNTCTEALENVVKPYLDTRLVDSDKQFFILNFWMLAKPFLLRLCTACVEELHENWQLAVQDAKYSKIHHSSTCICTWLLYSLNVLAWNLRLVSKYNTLGFMPEAFSMIPFSKCDLSIISSFSLHQPCRLCKP